VGIRCGLSTYRTARRIEIVLVCSRPAARAGETPAHQERQARRLHHQQGGETPSTTSEGWRAPHHRRPPQTSASTMRVRAVPLMFAASMPRLPHGTPGTGKLRFAVSLHGVMVPIAAQRDDGPLVGQISASTPSAAIRSTDCLSVSISSMLRPCRPVRRSLNQPTRYASVMMRSMLG